ncbi:hypothetical protein TSMEX_003109 [Taenia solium]
MHDSFALDKATITLKNVQGQQLLVLTNADYNAGIASTIFFVPRCRFPWPAPARLVKDANRDLRVFRGVFPGKSSRPRDRFTFTGSSTALVVSVDYTQSGSAKFDYNPK